MKVHTQPGEVQVTPRARGFRRTLSPEASAPDMITVMELPREDLLECRRRGDYQRYAWSLAGARARDDAFVKNAAIRRLNNTLDLGPVKDRNRLPFLVRMSRPAGDGAMNLARIFELGHLRDLLESMSSVDEAPALGDLPKGGGTLQVRIAAVATYDQSLLDGIAAWVEDDPELQEQSGDPDAKGQTSEWNKRATLRGFRLWELRRLVTGDYSEDAISGVSEDTGDPYVWAHKVLGKQSVLSRVSNLASWSPSRNAFQASEQLRASMLTRPHDVWTREKLSEHWDALRRRALEMNEREFSLEEISAALRVHPNTIEQWLPGEGESDS